jgi:hypothetical protein
MLADFFVALSKSQRRARERPIYLVCLFPQGLLNLMARPILVLQTCQFLPIRQLQMWDVFVARFLNFCYTIYIVNRHSVSAMRSRIKFCAAPGKNLLLLVASPASVALSPLLSILFYLSSQLF